MRSGSIKSKDRIWLNWFLSSHSYHLASFLKILRLVHSYFLISESIGALNFFHFEIIPLRILFRGRVILYSDVRVYKKKKVDLVRRGP